MGSDSEEEGEIVEGKKDTVYTNYWKVQDRERKEKKKSTGGLW